MRVLLFCYGVIFIAASIWGFMKLSPLLEPMSMAFLSLAIGLVSVIWSCRKKRRSCQYFLLFLGIGLGCLTLIEFFKVDSVFLGNGATTWLHFMMTVPALTAGATR